MVNLGKIALVFLSVLAVWPLLSVAADPVLNVNPAQVSEATKRQVEGPVRWILLADKAEKERKRQALAKAAAERAAAERLAAEHAAARRASAVAGKPAAPQAGAPAAVAAVQPAAVLPAAALPVAAIAPVAALPPPAAEPEEDELPSPKLLDLVEPFISESIKARLNGKGKITVRFAIQPNGSVRGVEVVETSHPALRQPVLSAVEQWRYAAPGRVVEKVVQLQIAPD